MDTQVGTSARLVALAAALIAGAAGATETRGALYADLRMSLDYTEDTSAASGPTFTSTDNNSMWGVKASTARGGVRVFGGYERFLDAGDPNIGFPLEVTRQAYLGLDSMCGMLKFGRHATAYAEAGRKLDPFYNTAVSGTAGVAAAGSIFGGRNSHGSATAFNADALDGAYVADHFAYRSPAFAGFAANVALFLDESGSSDQNHDFGGGIEYVAGGITAGAQFIDANGAHPLSWGANVEATRLYAGYTHTRFGVGASLEQLDVPGAMTENYLMVSGWYGLREDTRVAVSAGVEDDSARAGESVRAGVFHDVIENFTIWLAGRYYNDSTALNNDSTVVSIGASYKFDLGFSSE
jgi:hypothetical protein